MKRFLMLALNCMIAPVALAQPVLARQAVVESINCGEIDPIVIGDACVAFVRADDGEELALVAPIELLDRYSDAALVALAGHAVDINDENLSPVDNPEVVDLLAVSGDARACYWWNGRWSVD